MNVANDVYIPKLINLIYVIDNVSAPVALITDNINEQMHV